MKTNSFPKWLLVVLPLGLITTFIVMAACNHGARDVGNSINWQPRNGGFPPEDTPVWQECQISGPYEENGRQYYLCEGRASFEVFYDPDKPNTPITIKRPSPGNPDGQQPTGNIFVWSTERTKVRCVSATAPCQGSLSSNNRSLCDLGVVTLGDGQIRWLYSGHISRCGSN